MKKLYLLALLPLLAGCNTIGTLATLNAPNPVTLNRAYQLRLAFDAAEVLAIDYIRRPLCPAALVCSLAPVSAQLRAAGPKARVALNNLTAYVKVHPTINAGAIFDAATTAIGTFQSVESNNGIK